MKRSALAAVLACCLLASCTQLPELGQIKKPTVTLTNVGYKEVGVVGLTMKTNLSIENPNPFTVYTPYIYYTLNLGDVKVGYGSRRKNLEIKAYSREFIEVPIQLTFLDMVSSIINAIHKKSGKYRIDGEMILRTKTGDHPFPFQKEGTTCFLQM
jgi:LEA14-like dessication related protein